MNAVLAPVKTAIPQWLLDCGEAYLSALQEPAWLKQARQQQWQHFLKQGWPTKSQENWKYTDLSLLAAPRELLKPANAQISREMLSHYRLKASDSLQFVFIDGCYQPELSDGARLPAETILCDMTTASHQYASLLQGHAFTELKNHPFASLNGALFNTGLLLCLPANCVLPPVHFLFLHTAKSHHLTQPRMLIILGENSRLTVTEEHVGEAISASWTNICTTLVVKSGANFSFCKIQDENPEAIHVATSFIQQKKDSVVDYHTFSSGAALAREDLFVQLQEQGAVCHTGGFYRLQRDQQYLDHHLYIEHQAAHSQSEMLFKGILDKKSRAVFNGKLYVQPHAQKIKAYQANHNLLLAKEAEIYTKPELEIYADDVQCKHGAAVGQVDQEALFYLRSRGIEAQEALKLLLDGFAEEVLRRIPHAATLQRVKEVLACR